jgi:hypothetical protein
MDDLRNSARLDTQLLPSKTRNWGAIRRILTDDECVNSSGPSWLDISNPCHALRIWIDLQCPCHPCTRYAYDRRLPMAQPTLPFNARRCNRHLGDYACLLPELDQVSVPFGPLGRRLFGSSRWPSLFRTRTQTLASRPARAAGFRTCYPDLGRAPSTVVRGYDGSESGRLLIG